MVSPELRERLKYVKLASNDVDLQCFPDFLIIGPQRTGTTWLHANLREHPEIFLTEPKEIFFFSRLSAPDDPRFESAELGWYLRFFRDPAWRYLARQALCLRNHKRLYRPKVRGEATASYAALDRDIIGEITAIKPDIKAIMMVRNPIDRAWSHAKKDLARNCKRPIDEVSDEEFHAFFAEGYQQRCAQYCVNLENWSSCLAPGNLFLGMFDDIAERPEELLVEVMSFLGVTDDVRFVGRAVRKSVNPAGSKRIPDRHHEYLASLLERELAEWQERFGRD